MTSINTELDKNISDILNKYKSNTNTHINNLVLNGGGLKGIGHIGALKYMTEHKLLKKLKTIAGSSMGGIVGAMYIAGYTPEELLTFMNLLDVSRVISMVPANMLSMFGFDDGTKVTFVLSKLLEAKNYPGNITLKQFYQRTQIKLIITTVCLNDSDVNYLSYITAPDMELVTALRMTSALPFIFAPIKYKDKLYTDGGCMDNYPIRLFDNELNTTIGVHVRPSITRRKSLDNVEDFTFSLFQCLSEGINCTLLKGYEDYSIDVPLPDVAITTENVTADMKTSMYNDGYNAAKLFFENRNNKTKK